MMMTRSFRPSAHVWPQTSQFFNKKFHLDHYNNFRPNASCLFLPKKARPVVKWKYDQGLAGIYLNPTIWDIMAVITPHLPLVSRLWNIFVSLLALESFRQTEKTGWGSCLTAKLEMKEGNFSAGLETSNMVPFFDFWFFKKILRGRRTDIISRVLFYPSGFHLK